MLNVFYSIAGFCIILSALLFLVKAYLKFSKYVKTIEKIPGPPGLPIVGNLFNIMLPQDLMFLSDRERASKYYPIYGFTVFNKGIVGVLAPEDIEIILHGMKHTKKNRIYRLLEPWLGTGLLTSFGNKWQRRRKILTPAFHFTILQDFIKVFNRCTEELIEQLVKLSSENSVIDIVPLISQMTLSAIVETSMGFKLDVKSESTRRYRDSIHYLGKIIVHRIARPWLHKNFLFGLTQKGRITKNTIKELHAMTRNVINERAKSENYSTRKRQAMLDLLLTAHRNDSDIDLEGIREEVDTFMFEGHDTTAIALCFIMFCLANHRDIQEEIHSEIIEVLGDNNEPTYNDLQELNYTDRCIKECLRLYPSVPFMARENCEDIQTTTGYTIPKGTSIHIPIIDIHRNPHLYPDPTKFDPDRFLPENIKNRHPFAYIPFSAGPRNCIGQRFALLELKAAICGILRKFRILPVDKVEDLVFLSDLVLRTQNGIKVKFVSRQ